MIFFEKELKELKKIRRSLYDWKLVWTNGCFDVLHKGHEDYLKKASELGDCLIVGLNNDDSVRRLKGKGRPVNNVYYRSEKLDSLDFVDYIFVFEGLDSLDCLRELKPDVYVKGGDYGLESINQDERRLVESYGGSVRIIPVVYDISTTKILDGEKKEQK